MKQLGQEPNFGWDLYISFLNIHIKTYEVLHKLNSSSIYMHELYITTQQILKKKVHIIFLAMEKCFFLRKYFEAKAVVGDQLTHQKKKTYRFAPGRFVYIGVLSIEM